MGRANAKAIKLAKNFKSRAMRKYSIRRMILFGSQVTGKTRIGSDIDLLIVSDSFRSRAAFMSELSREWHIIQKKRHPVDFICYTPEEFENLRNKITIVKQALEEGVEI